MEGIAKLITDSHESLAHSVAEGFAGVDKRFEAVDKRFEAVDKRFEAVDKQFNQLEGKITQQIQGLGNRIDDLALNRATREELIVLDKRVGRIESKLGISFKKSEHA